MDEREDFSKGALGEIHDTLRPLFIHVLWYPEHEGNIVTVAVYDTKRKEVQMRTREKLPDSQKMKTARSEWKSLPTPRAVRDFQRQGRKGFESTMRQFNLDGQFLGISPTASHEELMRTLRTSALFNIW